MSAEEKRVESSEGAGQEPAGVRAVYFAVPGDAEAARRYVSARLARVLRLVEEPDCERVVDEALEASAEVAASAEPAEGVSDPEGLAGAAVEAMREAFPLLEGERPEGASDLFVSGGSRRGGVPLARLKTDLATTYVEIPGAAVEGSRLTRGAPPPAPADDAGPVQFAGIAALAATLGKELGGAILKTAGAKAWQYVSVKVLGFSDIPAYFDEVFDRIISIVHAEAVRTELRGLQARALDFADYVKRYNEHGDMHALEKAEDVAIKMKDRSLLLDEAAFLYADAAVMNIMLLQERYKISEKEGDRAAWRRQIADDALAYNKTLNEKRNRLWKQRMDCISESPFYTWKIMHGHRGREVNGVTEGDHGYMWAGQERGWVLAPAGGLGGPNRYQFEDSGSGFWWALNCDLGTLINFGKGTLHGLALGQHMLYRQGIAVEADALLKPLVETAIKLWDVSRNPVGDA